MTDVFIQQIIIFFSLEYIACSFLRQKFQKLADLNHLCDDDAPFCFSWLVIDPNGAKNNSSIVALFLLQRLD